MMGKKVTHVLQGKKFNCSEVLHTTNYQCSKNQNKIKAQKQLDKKE